MNDRVRAVVADAGARPLPVAVPALAIFDGLLRGRGRARVQG